MTLTELSPIPENSNPFVHDSYHMGVPIAGNWLAMYSTPAKDKDLQYLILVNSKTGQRVKVNLTDPQSEEHQKTEAIARLVQIVRGDSL